MSSLDEVTQYAIRAGVIQHFEFTYELSWKFIQRWLRLNASAEDAEPLTRRELFRTAARYGLIGDPQPWFRYSEADVYKRQKDAKAAKGAKRDFFLALLAPFASFA